MPTRRELLWWALALAPWARAEDVASFRRAAFDARTLAAALEPLGLRAPTPSPEVSLQAPDLHENGAAVPITLGCSAPGVQRLLLGIERNPTWLSALFEPSDALEPEFATRVKMQESSRVIALAQLADGRLLMASKEVRITLGGCGGTPDAAPESTGPTLMRVQAAPGGAVVRALMKHEMESGQRKDEAGRVLPPWHIQEVIARLNGKPVMSAQWGTSISKNPFLQFTLKGAKPGDRVALAWADNRGAQRSDEVTMA